MEKDYFIILLLLLGEKEFGKKEKDFSGKIMIQHRNQKMNKS